MPRSLGEADPLACVLLHRPRALEQLRRAAELTLSHPHAAENWVFLNGKVHNEYRKGLNVLFTPKALECVPLPPLHVEETLSTRCGAKGPS